MDFSDRSDGISTEISSEGDSVLSFLHVNKNMSGVYTCHVTNWNGSDNFNFTVHVEGDVLFGIMIFFLNLK